MVTNNREYEVARTIPSVSGIKAKYLPAGAGEAQVAVEDAYRSAVHINSRADGRHGGRSEVYLAVGVVGACSGGGGVESESSDVAKAFQVSTVDDGLREGIVIVCAGGTIAGGSVAHGRVEVLCGVAVVAETRRCRHHFPNTGVGARADMANVGVVAGKRGKAGEGSHGVGYKQHGTIAVGEACGAVFNLPAEASGRIGPSNVDARCRSIGGVQCLYFGTSGDVVEGDVVDISIPARGGTVGLDGYVLASAGIGAQQYLILSKCGVAIDVNGVNAYKGAGSVGIGHHTNLEYGVVAARRSLSPEAELQCRSVGSRVEFGQNNNLVVAIGTGGGSVVPVEALGAASGVVVGGGRAYIGIAAVGGTVVETGPAVNEGRTGSGAAGGFGLEVLGVGQCDGAASGAEANGGIHGGVAAGRAYAHLVNGVGAQARDGGVGVRGAGFGGGPGGFAVGTVVNSPACLLVAGSPADAGAGLVNAVNLGVGGYAGGVGQAVAHVEVDVGTVAEGGACVTGVDVGSGEGVAVLIAVGSLVRGAGVVAGHAARRGLARTALVNQYGEHDAARTIPLEGRVELVVLVARGAAGDYHGAVHLLVAGGAYQGGRADAGYVAVANEDGDFLVVAGASGEAQVDAGDGARGHACCCKFGGSPNLLGGGVAPARVGQAAADTGGAGADGGGVGGGGVKFGARQCHGGESGAVPFAVNAAAVGAHLHQVFGAGAQAGEHVAHVVGGEALGSALGVSLAQLDFVAADVGGAESGPADGGRGVARAGDSDAVHFGAGRGLAQGDVVNIGIPRCGGAHSLDGGVHAVAREVVKVACKLGPLGGVANGDGVNHLESGGVGGVGHHTGVEHGEVAGAGALGPEFQLQGVHRVGIGVDSGENHNLVVAVRTGGGAAIPVKAFRAVGGMVIRGAVGHIGVAGVAGAVVQQVPAVDKVGRAGARGVLIFESLRERQLRHQAAEGLEGGAYSIRLVGARADSLHRNGILRVGVHVRERVAGGRNRDEGVAVNGGAHADFPLAFGAAGGPADVSRLVGDVRHGQAAHHGAALLAGDVVEGGLRQEVLHAGRGIVDVVVVVALYRSAGNSLAIERARRVVAFSNVVHCNKQVAALVDVGRREGDGHGARGAAEGALVHHGGVGEACIRGEGGARDFYQINFEGGHVPSIRSHRRQVVGQTSDLAARHHAEFCSGINRLAFQEGVGVQSVNGHVRVCRRSIMHSEGHLRLRCKRQHHGCEKQQV